jgi:HAD superfamily hydrolase (TIGR01662 family)
VSDFDIVIPTSGRPQLKRLLAALDAMRDRDGDRGDAGPRVIVVDDRPRGVTADPLWPSGAAAGLVSAPGVEVISGPARGPAAARNVGWRASMARWIAFLDDDTIPTCSWLAELSLDIRRAPQRCAAVQGRVRVPTPAGRLTDWQRSVRALETARWATADMAFRRVALEQVDGFDERFARAYREDSDIAIRLMSLGWSLTRGARTVLHPPRRSTFGMSLKLQAGNADDVLMDRLHGPAWRELAGAPRGRLRRHLAVALAGLTSALSLSLGARRTGAAAGCVCLAGVGELAWARISPGPRTWRELATMALTSLLLPFWASAWWLRGHARVRRRPRRLGAVAAPGRAHGLPAAVMFDRDGTLIEDVPYNGDPDRVRPMAGARQALDELRRAGVPVAVVSNQSAIAHGRLRWSEVIAVNRRVEQVLGPVAPWLICPHRAEDRCSCRKPLPGMVLAVAALLGVDPRRCAVIGDIGADVEAARAAGARGVLVPTSRTLHAEIASAPEWAADLPSAVGLLIGDR